MNVPAEIRNKALAIMHDSRLGFSEMRAVRDEILAGDMEAAAALLRDEHELSKGDADDMLAYLGPA